jgi:hypothetical protein
MNRDLLAKSDALRYAEIEADGLVANACGFSRCGYLTRSGYDELVRIIAGLLVKVESAKSVENAFALPVKQTDDRPLQEGTP